MTIAGHIHCAAVRNVTFPLTNYLCNRRNIMGMYRSLRESEQLPPEVLQRIQLDRLRRVADFARKSVPFYAERFKAVGFEPGDIRHLDDIKGIPPLGREDVIDHARDLLDTGLTRALDHAERKMAPPGQPIAFARFRRNRLVRNTSSGSTGAPTVFYEDGSVTALNWSHELRLRGWFGIAPGEREVRMVRIAPDYLPKAPVNLLRRLLWNQLILPGVNLGEENYAYCVKEIARFRPAVIWGFTSALVGLADTLRNAAQVHPDWAPRLFIGWAAPLHDQERNTLTQVFNCPATNVYGSREVGHIAGKCPADCFHLNDESYLVEVDEHEEAAASPGCGELLVTSLYPTPMPFIRFRMGDIGSISHQTCPCGRTLRVLSELLGRTGEVFKTKTGRMISPNFWCRTFMDPKTNYAVRRFQVIYTRGKDLRIRIVRSSRYTDDTESYLRHVLARNFDATTRIDFEYPEAIAPLISGKYQMVVNETAANG